MPNSSAEALSASEIVKLRELLDHQEIGACLARIARGADRFDRDLYLSAFHDDGLVSVAGTTKPAAESFEGGRAGHAASTSATLHCLSTMNCEIDGDSAHAETYHIYCARNLDDTNWAAAGRYIDQLERRDGVWGVVFRHISVEWTGKLSPNAIALFAGAEAEKGRLSPSRDPGDVSYLRPLRS